MAQLVVRNLEETVKRGLKRRADAHGRSMEEEVRAILREAASGVQPPLAKKPQKGAGTRLMEIFAGKVPPEFEIPDFRSEPIRPVDFGE